MYRRRYLIEQWFSRWTRGISIITWKHARSNFFFFNGHPRLGVESELQLLACTTAPATLDPSSVCDLHHSSQQCGIL